MTNKIRREVVLEALRARAPRAAHVAEICLDVGVDKRNRDGVLDVLEELVGFGLAKEMPGQRFRAIKAAPSTRPPAEAPADHSERPSRSRQEVTLEGSLIVHPRGFGFVGSKDKLGDVYIGDPRRAGAMHGDLVEARAWPSDRGREGEIVRVVRRRVRRVTGTLRRSPGALLLDPDDLRLPGPMLVQGKPARGMHNGEPVLAEIRTYPEHGGETPTVAILHGLADCSETQLEVTRLEIAAGVVETFPAAVIEEAAGLPQRVLPRDRDGREDLRGIDLVTIDPEDARDHDDAVWAEHTGDGGYRIIVAIADVSHYVRVGTAIDDEAFMRSCSIYLPDRAVPMLPAELSTNLASLVAHKDRLTIAIEIELGPGGAVRHHRYINGLMRAGAALTYEGVARALGLAPHIPMQPKAEDRKGLLQTLYSAAQVLKMKRTRRGSLDFDLPEARIKLDPETQEPIDVVRARKDPGLRRAYNIVEELMLLANEVVAHDLEARGVPVVFRVHGNPDPKKVELFAEVAESFGHTFDLDDAEDPKAIAKLLRKVAGKPHAQVLHFLLLRAMQQAAYSTENIGHFGLAAPHYLHFTSPIRRYPDLAVHRVLKLVLSGEQFEAAPLKRRLAEVASQGSHMERRAMDVERSVVDLYRTVMMRDRLGETFDATITGLAQHGFYSSFDEPFVEALTPIEALGDDFYELDRLGIRLVGRRSGHSYTLGDRIAVTLEEASVERRQLIAMPEGMTRAPEGRRSPRDHREGARSSRARGSAKGERSDQGKRGAGARRSGAKGMRKDGGGGPERGGTHASRPNEAGRIGKAGKAGRAKLRGRKK